MLPDALRRAVPVMLVLASLGALVAACGDASDGSRGTASAADTLTRRQKDSIVSTLPVPGASAVGRALRASDRARQRALAHDSSR